MNVFIIHSGEDMDAIFRKKEELCQKCGKAKVLLLEYRKFMWKQEAKQMMRQAQMILYIVGKNSWQSKNINWELKKALKYHKSIVFLKLDPSYAVNKILLSKDPFTHEDLILADEADSIDDVSQIITNYEQGNYINVLNEQNTVPEELSRAELFEQYKLFSETSEALVNRRQNVNSFYITANTAIITIAATAFSTDVDFLSKLIITIALTIPGILLNHSWRQILRSYGITNSSKMKVLSVLEKHLSASLYDAEWEVMSNKYNKEPYVSFTDSEKALPLIFIVVYVCVDLICLCAFLAL